MKIVISNGVTTENGIRSSFSGILTSSEVGVNGYLLYFGYITHEDLRLNVKGAAFDDYQGTLRFSVKIKKNKQPTEEYIFALQRGGVGWSGNSKIIKQGGNTQGIQARHTCRVEQLFK